MRQKSGTGKAPAEQVTKDIRCTTRKKYWSEEKIRIVLEGLRGEESIAALCRREGVADSLYYNWSKEFLEAGRKRLAGDLATWLSHKGMEHTRGAPCHPQTQGKIERWHQTLKNRIQLERGGGAAIRLLGRPNYWQIGYTPIAAG